MSTVACLRVSLTLAACALLPRLGAAQTAPERHRPPLPAGQDTNSAGAYYAYGMDQLRQSPARAADAFYWATRIEPALPEPWLGLSAALSLAQPTRALGDYLIGAAYVAKDRQFQHIDSLRYQALIRNPLMYLPLDAVLLEEWFSRVTRGELTIQELSSEFGPEMAAWWAYSRGRFNDAIRQYSIAVKRHPKWYGLRADRARAYLPLMQYDSAVAAYNELLGLQQQAEEERLVHVYNSKELVHFTIGRIREAQGDYSAARESYGRSLTENLGFYPAHLALARLDLATGDSTAAQAEFDQTIQIDSRDAVAHYEYGVLLFMLKRYEAATEQFQQAVDDEPYFAKPYFPLAYLRESEGKDSVAIATYRRFIQIAPASLAGQVELARRRLGEAAPH